MSARAVPCEVPAIKRNINVTGAFVIQHHSASTQFCRDAAISVVAAVFQSNLPNSRSHYHVLFRRRPAL
jgi:hypothetical protein